MSTTRGTVTQHRSESTSGTEIVYTGTVEIDAERIRRAERKRIAKAVAELPSFDDAVDRAAVLAIVLGDPS